MTKHLSLSERIIIEKMINADYTFASIARKLHRSASTVSREVLNHRSFVDKPTPDGKNDCVNRLRCIRNNICHDVPIHGCYFYRCKSCPDHTCTEICEGYISEHCAKLDKPPYVCTNCKHKNKCKRNHAYYTAHRAQSEYKKYLSSSRCGVRKTTEEIEEIGRIIEPLIKRGQSPAHICAAHVDELGICERTLYNYIDNNVFAVRNIDLPKKVAYRKRRERKPLTHMEYKYRLGRTYEDFKSYIKAYPDVPVVEMDTVKGARGKGKVLLTMIFRKSSFMLVFLLPDARQESVIGIFDMLTDTLGVSRFQRLFPVILTDNGVEFKDVNSLEFSPAGVPRTRLFYCDPQASWQKPQVENNHKLIRRILPKGQSFMQLNTSDVRLITNHINSVIRDNLNFVTPFDMMTSDDETKLLSLLKLQSVPPDEVLLKPALIKHK